jgi:hypothetical protein
MRSSAVSGIVTRSSAVSAGSTPTSVFALGAENVVKRPSQVVKKFRAFYANLKFGTAFSPP